MATSLARRRRRKITPEENDAVQWRNRLITTGITGTIIALICCVTPILVILVSAIGLTAVIGYLDYVLFPAMAIFLGLIVYGWRTKRRLECDHPTVLHLLSDSTAEYASEDQFNPRLDPKAETQENR